MSRVFIKNFEDFEGLDLTSSDLSRRENFAQALENWEHIGLKSIRGRRGFKKFAFHEKGGSGTFDAQAHGIATYKHLAQNDSTVKLQENLLVFYGTKSILYETTGTVTIAYVGGAATHTLSILFDTVSETYKAYFKEAGVVTQTVTLTTTTVSTFVSTVNAYANWNCVLTSPTTFPTIGASTTEPLAIEAFELMEDKSISTGGGTAIEIHYMAVRNALQNKFTSGSAYNNYSFVNGYGQAVSWVNKNNVLYIASGRRLMKWDGMNFYDIGMPYSYVNSITPSLGVGLSNGLYKYRVRWHFKDFQQNDIYGDYVEVSATATPPVNNITLNLDPTVMAQGWNAKFARVNGLQAAVTTITVDAGHTFEIGDPFYTYDTATSTYVERYVTATAATTITISGAVISVADNQAISCNLRAEISRTTANGVDFYHVADLTFDIAAWNFIDSMSDATLITQELSEYPDLPFGAGDFASVVAVHQGKLLTCSGVTPYEGVDPGIDIPYEFDDNFIEAFSSLATIRIPSTTTSQITCLHSDNDSMLAVFKEDSYYNIVGDIGTDGNYEIVVKSEQDIGCPSPHSIQKINALGGSLFCSNRGFALLKNGEIDETIGERTRIAFQDIDYYRGQGLSLETVVIKERNEGSIIPYKAVSVNNNLDGKYICMIPAYSGTWGTQVTQIFERCFVFDYRYNKWGEWTFSDCEPNGGLVMYKNKLHSLQVETSYAYPGTSSTCQVWRELKNEVTNLQTGSTYANSPQYDYIDGATPISYRFMTTGLHLGDPSILKIFLACKIYQLQTAITAFSLRLQTVRNFDYSQSHSDVNYSFSTTTKEQAKDLKRSASRVLAFEFSQNEYHKCPMMSGYEIEMDEDYQQEGVVRK